MAVRRTPGASGLTLERNHVISTWAEWMREVGNIQYPVEFIVHDVACGAEIDGVNDLIVAIVLVTVEILRLTTMP